MNRDITSCMGYQQIVGAVAATALTIPTRDNNGTSAIPTMAVIIVEGQAVRYRDDGTNPTAAVGMPISIGTAFFYDGDLRSIRFIQTAATATINVSYYK